MLFETVLLGIDVIKYQTNFDTRLQTTREGILVVLNFLPIEPEKIKARWVEEIKVALVGTNNVDKVDQVLHSPTTGNLLVRLCDQLGSLPE